MGSAACYLSPRAGPAAGGRYALSGNTLLGTFRVVEVVKEKLSTSVKHSDKTRLPRCHTVQHYVLQEPEVKLISLEGLRVENY